MRRLRAQAYPGGGAVGDDFQRQALDVMYPGRVCGVATAQNLIHNAKHPDTLLLLDTIPDTDIPDRQRLPVRGEEPSPITPPSACTFHPRCALGMPPIRCDKAV